jgi:hypothetical protein
VRRAHHDRQLKNLAEPLAGLLNLVIPANAGIQNPR